MTAAILLRFTASVLLLAVWPFSLFEFAYGTPDFHVELDERYGISRTNVTEVAITDRGRPRIPKLGGAGKRSIGPLYEVHWNSRCVFAKHHGFTHVAGMIDEISSYRFVIIRGSGRMRGPYSEKKFQRVARSCGVRGKVPWMTVRQAYIWSMETYPDQRWNLDFFKGALFTAFMQGLFLLLVLAPVFLGLAVILYLIDRFVIDRIGRKRWNVWPYLIPGWPVTAIGVAFLSFLNETFLLLF